MGRIWCTTETANNAQKNNTFQFSCSRLVLMAVTTTESKLRKPISPNNPTSNRIMIYEINYKIYVIIGLFLIWPVVSLKMWISDSKKSKRRNFMVYALWPLVVTAELLS